MQRGLGALLIVASIALALPCAAEPDRELEAAKQLGTEALGLFDKGAYADALAKFDQADAHAKIPTLDLFAARCLDKLGRLLQAKERYEAVTHAVLPVGSSPKWREAQEDARKELDSLAGRIPTLTIHPEGVGDRRVTMTLDEQSVLAIEQPQSVDPGHHEVVLVVGAKRYVKVVELREGEHPVVAIVVESEPAALAPKAPTRPEGPKPLLVVGATALAVGGAGVIVWGATGAAALAKASSQHCKGGVCEGSVSRLASLRTTSTVGFYVGVPLAILGTTLLVVHAVTDKKSAATVSIGPRSVDLALSF